MTELAPLPAEEAAEEIEGGFSRRAIAWIVASVAASFVAAVLLGVYGADLERRPTAGTNTFSDSALGHRAAAELLRALGFAVRSRQAPAGGLGPRSPLILAEPYPDRVRLQALRDEARARAAPLLLVLHKWRPGAARTDKPEWLAEVDLLSESDVLGRVRAVGIVASDWVLKRYAGKLRCSAAWRHGDPPVDFQVDVPPAQLFAGMASDFGPLVICPGGVLVARRQATATEPQLVLVADPDLLNNHGLGRGDNAAVVYQLLTRGLGATGVVFDETVHGFNRTPGLFAEALRFPMSLGVLQSLLLLGIVLWAGMGRFGKPLPASAGLAAGKEVLIDNTAKLLASGGEAGDSLARYFRQTTRAVAAHYFLPSDLPESERLARLQRLTDARGGRLSLAELERSIYRLPDGRRGGEPAQKIARRLHQWRVEMTNGNRESP